MTIKEKLNKISDAAAGELLANNCYKNLRHCSCFGNCSECFTKYLSSEVEENEITKSN